MSIGHAKGMQILAAFFDPNKIMLLRAFMGAEEPKLPANELLIKIEKMGDGYSAEKTRMAAQILLDCNTRMDLVSKKEDKEKEIATVLGSLTKAGFHVCAPDNEFKEFVPETVVGCAARTAHRQIGLAMGELQSIQKLYKTKCTIMGLAEASSHAHGIIGPHQ